MSAPLRRSTSSDSIVSSGSSTSSSSSGWQDTNIQDDQDEIVPMICLFCQQTFDDSARHLFDHCKKTHNFDWYHATGKQGLDLDFYGKIKLINYLRANPQSSLLALKGDEFRSDKYMKPFLEDDTLLVNFDEENDENPQQADEVQLLKQQLADMEAQFQNYKEHVSQSFLEEVEKRDGSSPQKESGIVVPSSDNDSHYFQSYSGNDIHETMLKDSVRTDSYRDFIYENKDIFKDKIVLDVGCGTGILSMFCARAGAKKVFAVDNSAIIDKARANIFENSLDSVITCFHGKMEEIDLPVKQVDIIVSEWMGYCLLYEAMLDSVLYARDKYLSPSGLMVPSICKLLIVGVHDPEYINDTVNFWNNVYGFRMSAMKERIREDVVVAHLQQTSLATKASCFLNLPLHSITKEELCFTVPFELVVDETMESLDAFLIYFDNYFLVDRGATIGDNERAESWKGRGISFTTGPGGKETHWRQGVLLIDNHVGLIKAGETIQGTITYKKGKENLRELDIVVDWKCGSKQEQQMWYMR